MTTHLFVFTTVATREDARRLARDLVELRLAACAQISAIESVYRWQGEVEEAPEYRVLFKTVDSRYAEVQAAILERHPYELPALYALRAEHAEPRFADWVSASVQA